MMNSEKITKLKLMIQENSELLATFQEVLDAASELIVEAEKSESMDIDEIHDSLDNIKGSLENIGSALDEAESNINAANSDIGEALRDVKNLLRRIEEVQHS